jgi:hypothetical protein
MFAYINIAVLHASLFFTDNQWNALIIIALYSNIVFIEHPVIEFVAYNL